MNPDNWINNFSDELYRYAVNKTSDASLAEDLVQETFLSALKSAKNFKGLSSERTWLFTILKFKIADYYRKASTKFEIANSKMSLNNDLFLENYFKKNGEWKASTFPNDWSLNDSTAIENEELAQVLNICIDKLPKAQKALILMKLVEEQETKEVCKELNISSTNYWVIIHRAKLQLRVCLEKKWFNS